MISINIKYLLATLCYFYFLTTPFAQENTEIYNDSIRSYIDQGKFQEATVTIEKWVKEARNNYTASSVRLLIPLVTAGKAYILMQEFSKGIDYMEEALGIMKETTGWLYPDYAIATNYLITGKLLLKEVDDVPYLLKEINLIHEKTIGKNNLNYAQALFNQGLYESILGNYDLAEENYLAAIQLSKQFPVKRIYMLFEVYLNQIYLHSSNTEQVITNLLLLKKKAEDLDYTNSFVYTRILLVLGDAYKKNTEYGKATLIYNLCERKVAKIFGPNHNAFANVLTRIASIYMLQSKYSVAKVLLKKANKIYEEDQNQLSRHNTVMLNLTALYIKEGKYDKAQLYFDKVALTINRDIENQNYFSINKARFEMLDGNYIDAELILSELVNNLKKENLQSTPNYAQAISMLIDLSVILGRINRAEILLNEWTTFLTENTMERTNWYFRAMITKAKILSSQEQYTASIALLEEVDSQLYQQFKKAHFLNIRLNILLGENYHKLVKLDKAKFYYQKSITVAGKLQFYEKNAVTLKTKEVLLTIDVEEGNYQDKEKQYLEILSASKKDILFHTRTQSDLATLYARTGNWKAAEKLIIEAVNQRLNLYRSTLNYSSENEKRLYLKKTRYVFETFYALIMMEGENTLPALSELCYNLQIQYKNFFLDEGKNRKKEVIDFRSERKKYDFPTYLTQMDHMRSQVASLNFMSPKQRTSLNADGLEIMDRVNNLEKALVFAADAFADTVYVQNLDTWKDIQSKLEANDIAIEIIKVSDKNKVKTKYFALIVTYNNSSPTMIDIGNSELLENQVYKEYKTAMVSKSRSLVLNTAPSKRVNTYNALWSPIKNKIASDVQKIYISCDGVYNLININTLKNPTTQKYVIEEDFILPLTSTSELLIDSPSKIKNKTALMIGNPTFQNYGTQNSSRGEEEFDEEEMLIELDELPGTEIEINNAASLLKSKGWQVTTVMKDAATEAYVKNIETSPEVLHIATHGFFISDIPYGISNNVLLRSGLFFTEITNKRENIEAAYSTGIDGILTAYEVKSLNLSNTELLILSACQTGVSEITEGEGVSGLQSAFSIAGANSIVMSLWSVDDNATQMLMNNFYERWTATNDKYTAFRLAQLDIMQKYSKPYYWGAFIMVN
ncbi:CHAT domain-containing protein [Flammeovirga kamogawensis]|uniref:CHAT domain-containing protein n=1 Tax=Flammeovirga kamogawensis TaxID=373891 RepID=A0ABX8H4N2_9BACT|nr:CHAT domain-containing protein [Flammeovirga kamogawensis]MBB6463515.1 CHAT domain-containing protein [Flammeovirga kamogawensis]QWG10574.1 CHAT domain-containing protein [Flammeovirga kamogawensis]TRX63680.1 CHAT domain-containing protein [Flammeovirga kamogawensis]